MPDLKSELEGFLALKIVDPDGAQRANARKRDKSKVDHDERDVGAMVHVAATPPAPLARHEEGVARVRELVGAAKNPRTLRAYAADWRAFEAWCTENGHVSAPPAPETVALYLAYLFDRKIGRKKTPMKVKSIERALAGVIFTVRTNGFAWETPLFIREQMDGIRKKRAQAGIHTESKDALAKTDLERIVEVLPRDLRGVRDRAILAISFVGAFRRSEVAGLDVSDVKFVPREGLDVRPRTSKTDQKGQNEGKALPLQDNHDACPVHTLRAWLDAAGIERGPLFRRVHHDGTVGEKRLSDKSIAEIVKRAVKLIGLDPAKYSGHSPRAGFATAAAADGRGLDEIMNQTGHRSVTVARGYIRHGTRFTKNAAKGMFR